MPEHIFNLYKLIPCFYLCECLNSTSTSVRNFVTKFTIQHSNFIGFNIRVIIHSTSKFTIQHQSFQRANLQFNISLHMIADVNEDDSTCWKIRTRDHRSGLFMTEMNFSEPAEFCFCLLYKL